MILKATALHEMLDKETAIRSGHEERVGKLSMSWLYLSEQEILKRVREGVQMDDHQKLKLYLGTHCEKGIRDRLEAICKSIGHIWTPPKEISSFNGKLTGHIDGAIDRALVEIKTVPDEETLNVIKARGRIPFKVESQINSYMLWGPFERSLVIYEERENGTHWITEHFPNKQLQRDLHFKVQYVLGELGKGSRSSSDPGRAKTILVKELRHVILRELKKKAFKGTRAQMPFGELWAICSAAGPSMATPLNADLSRDIFTQTLMENLKLLSTTDVIGVVTIEDDTKIDFIFLTKIGEQYVDGVDFR